MSKASTPGAAGGFDLAAAPDVKSREDEGLVVKVRDVHGEPMTTADGGAVTIRIAGSYSAVYRRTQDAQHQRWGRRGQLPDAAEARQNRLDLTVACIMAWEGFTNGGQPFPFTKENALLLLSKCPYIHEQLETAQHDHSRFFASPSPS